MMEAILNIQNLYKHYDGIVAVDHVNFTLGRGEVVGIFGENGVGKTTLFNLINGFEKADTGHVFFKGKDITRSSVRHRAKQGIGRLFQTPRIFGDITVLDNLLAAGNNKEARYLHNYLLKYPTIKRNILLDSERAKTLLEQFGLRVKAGHKASALSVGEKRLLSLGSLLMNDSELLLLDEPYAGISESAQPQIKSMLASLKNKGTSVLLIEHDKTKLYELADSVYLMKKGKLYPVTNT